MLTSKQRAFLRGLASDYETMVMIGKNGMTPEIVKQTADALVARELIKGKVLVETSPVTPREAADTLAEATESDVVQVIGSKFVLYKRKPKDPVIVLPKANK